MKLVLASSLLLLLGHAAMAFTVVPRIATSSSTSQLGLWIDEQDFAAPYTSIDVTKDIRARVEACLEHNLCDVQAMTNILHELEALENECTEEGRQTDEECDVEFKAERQAWMKELENRISTTAASTMVMMFMSSPSTIANLEDRARSCLDGRLPMTMKQMTNMLQSLEEVNNLCTEDGHQTDDECDVEVKAEREALMKGLEKMVESPSMALVEYTLQHQEDVSLHELTQMMASLEDETNMCTEECNQTLEECDILVKDQREVLMGVVGERIVIAQKEASSKTKQCGQYKLCNTDAMTRSLKALEKLDCLCTEEGHQTKRFCSIEAKAEREELIEQLTYELELAKAVTADQRSVFQI